VYGLIEGLHALTDKRIKARIQTGHVVLSAFIMLVSRLGSLHSLRQTQESDFWKKWLPGKLPSDDTIGRVFCLLDVESIRECLRQTYLKIKRNKALTPRCGNRFTVVLDGHESNASFLRCCDECLERRIRTVHGERIQYYHRNVTALLQCKRFPLLLDVEAQKKGENEVAAAIRLFRRLLQRYGRSFDLVVVDALYCHSGFFQLALSHGKDVIAVLKENRNDLLQDALGVFRRSRSVVFKDGNRTYSCWDEEDFSSWPQIDRTVRVVRSVETTSVCRQKDGRKEKTASEWIWVGTISKKQIATKDFVRLAHERWVIENQELNELVNYWHVDHVYRHHPIAILAFWLLAMLAYNLFHAFLHLNLKAVVSQRFTKLHWARILAADLYYPLRC
jgi:hypothetical protein